MSSARFVARGSKSRLFCYVCCLFVLGTVVYIFHGTQSQLEDAKLSASKCAMQHESLFKQLRVTVEYKLMIEDSLQKVRKEKETLQTELETAKEVCRNNATEANTMYNALNQKYEVLKTEHNLCKESLTKVQQANFEYNDKNSKSAAEMEKLKETYKTNLKAEKAKFVELQTKYAAAVQKNIELADRTEPESEKVIKLKKEITELNEKLRAYQPSSNAMKGSSVKPIDKSNLKNNENNEMIAIGAIPKAVSSANTSTTPVINPQAVQEPDVMNQGQNLLISPSATASSSNNQSAVPPLQLPLDSMDTMNVAISSLLNKKNASPKNPQPANPEPDENVAPKPKVAAESSDALESPKKQVEEENQDKNLGVLPGPMNPIKMNNQVNEEALSKNKMSNFIDDKQDLSENKGNIPAPPPPAKKSEKAEHENRLMGDHDNQFHDLNGAHEQEDDNAPGAQEWHQQAQPPVGEVKEIPKQKGHFNYQDGGDYRYQDRNDEDEEGEQDYMGHDQPVKGNLLNRLSDFPKFPQHIQESLRNNPFIPKDGVMVQPK